VPVIEIRPPVSFEPLDQALQQLGLYDWLILTTQIRFAPLPSVRMNLGVWLQAPTLMKVAAVGEATAAAARKAGFAVDLVRSPMWRRAYSRV